MVTILIAVGLIVLGLMFFLSSIPRRQMPTLPRRGGRVPDEES